MRSESRQVGQGSVALVRELRCDEQSASVDCSDRFSTGFAGRHAHELFDGAVAEPLGKPLVGEFGARPPSEFTGDEGGAGLQQSVHRRPKCRERQEFVFGERS